jgi:hypothetical protein
MTDERPRCPECGGVVVLVTDGLVGRLMAPPFFIRGRSELTYEMHPAPFAACTACEFCLEITE